MTTNFGLLFAAGLVLAVILCSICVWAPRRAIVKAGALVVAALLVPLGYAAMAELMSKPKPVSLEWWNGRAANAAVLGSSIREGQGIYLWLQLDSVPEPRAYVLPWSRELAQELQEAMREAESNQGGVGMRLPFEPTLDDREPKFYAMPQPALPPKDSDPASPAMRFERPGTDA